MTPTIKHDLQCSNYFMLDKSEVFEGDSITVECAASKVEKKPKYNCVRKLCLSRLPLNIEREEHLAEFVWEDLQVHIILSNLNWRYDSSNNTDNVSEPCNNEDKIKITLHIDIVKLDDGGYYRCQKLYDQSAFTKSFALLRVYPQSSRRPTAMPDKTSTSEQDYDEIITTIAPVSSSGDRAMSTTQKSGSTRALWNGVVTVIVLTIGIVM